MKKKTAPDRRILRTRRSLLDALVGLILEKGYEAVTVQDVIDRADVGRSTFYAHFHDKEDLLLSGFESLREQFELHLLGESAAPAEPWALSLRMFEQAQGHYQLYKALAGQQSGKVVLDHIHRYLSALVRVHLKTQFRGRRPGLVPPEILAHYLVSSFMALLTWWLDHEQPYPAERMNAIYRQLTEPGIAALLNQ
jgi:AcrR family transcriptional regulator